MIEGTAKENLREFSGNPYLTFYQKIRARESETQIERWAQRWRWRKRLTKRYSWGVPSDEAILALAESGPLIEIGAGTGYWARLVEDRGGQVSTYDLRGPDCGTFHPVKKGGVEMVKMDGGTSSLFLCWPPYNTDMAQKALSLFQGEVVCYVGEEKGGCTGDDIFHELLCDDWSLQSTIPIPQWEGIHDSLFIFKRK